MLDKWLNVIVQRLENTAAAVVAKRAAIEKERAGDIARDHAGREFVNSEGYTTPLPKAAQNAQNEYARARRDFEKADLAKALAAAIAMIVARERRDETAAALKAHLAADDLRKAEGVHPEVKPFFALMFALGVDPRRLANVRPETLAIICDIIMWDGHDPDLEDPDSPMPGIFDLYSTRQILMLGQFHDRSRSKPGVPVRPVRYTDPHYFMFNEILPQQTESGGEASAGPQTLDAEPESSIDQANHNVAEADVSNAGPPPSVLPSDQRGDMSETITPEVAIQIAKVVYDKLSYKMDIYWPTTGHDIGDFGPGLVPALEKWVAEDPWVGAQEFLAAARDGKGREFIENERVQGIGRFAHRLLKGDERALEEAKSIGVL